MDFQASLDNDIAKLTQYQAAVTNGMAPTEAMDRYMRGASEAAIQYTSSTDAASISTTKFGTSQKMAAVSTEAQSKSLLSAKSLITEYNNGCKNVGISQSEFITAVSQSNSGLATYLTNLNGAKGSLTGYVASLVGAKVATVALRVATIALNTALTMGISLLVQGAISAISSLINHEKEAKEAAREAAQDISNSYSEATQSISDNINTLKGLESEFNTLSKGVDDYGNNISLSADEYSRYREIVESIVGISPELISGYDAEGNAIANKNGLLEQSIALMQEEQRLKKEEITSESNLKTLLSASKQDIEDIYDKFEDVEIPANLGYSGVKVTFDKDGNRQEDYGYVNKIPEYIESVIGVAKDEWDESTPEYILNNIDEIYSHLDEILSVAASDFEYEGTTWAALSDSQIESLRSYIVDIRAISDEIGDVSDEFNNYLQLIPESLTQYSDLDDSSKSFLSNWIKEYFSIDSNTTENDIKAYSDEIKRFTKELASDEGLQNIVAESMSLKNRDNSLTANEYKEQISSIIDEINSIEDEDTVVYIKAALGIEDEEDLTKDIDEMLQHVKGMLLDEYDDNALSMSISDLQIAYSISADENSLSFDELNSLIEEQKKASAISFSELMGDESFSSSIDNYINKVTELQETLENYRNGDFSNEDLISLIEEYPELANESDNLVDAIENQIRELTGYEKTVDSAGNTVQEATGIMAVFEDAFGRVDSEEDVAALENFMDAVLELGNVVGSTQFAIDIDTEVDSMQNLWTAMKESVSSTGLTSESIANLRSRYAELEKQGYDVAGMFEKTENGIHLNTTALRELEHAYEMQRKNDIASSLDDLVTQYNDLTTQINNASDAASTADLYAQRADIQSQIDETAILAAQYEGLTSAFYKWEQAQSIGEEGDMYDSLANGLESIKELYDDGLIGTNKFRTAVQLMSNEDLSTANADELLDAYEAGYSKMTRYFQDGSDGVLHFLNDLQNLNSEWVSMNQDGSWDINFGLGNDQEIADALGINVESVQAIMRKLSDYGFEINLDSVYSSFDLLSSKAEEANDKLKELGKTDYTFNFGSTDLDYIVDEQLPKAESLLDEFRNSDGSINLELEGAQEAQDIFISLMSQKQALSAPAIMSIDTTAINEADSQIGDAIASLQEFVQLSNDLEIQTTLGVDTSDTQTKIQTVATDLQSIPDEVKTKLGIDSEEFNTALQNITNTEVNVDAGITISQEDIASVQASIDSIQAKDIEMLTNSAAVTSELNAIDEYTIGNKSFSVSISNSPMSTLYRINSYQIADKSYTITAKTVGGSQASGTAHAEGTAKASGDWSVGEAGVSLGGEEKPELVVRNGRWFTIGDDSAEFFRHEKGDIIFNGDQTEQIFKYGKIRTGKKRGKSFASGTAFSSGSGKITASGSVITKPSGSSSSSNKSNSNNNSSDSEEKESKIIDWIEIAIDRIERAIDRLATVATSPFRTLAERINATNDELSKMSYELSLQQSAYNRYMQQANSVGLSSDLASKVQNGTIDINEYDEDTAEKISDYQEWYEKALDCKDAILELSESISELYQNKFNDVADDYENQLSLIEHLTNTYNNGIDDLEERGYLASTKYYEALKNVEKQNIDIRKQELSDLTKQMSEAINSGSIKEGSEAWYEFQQQINDVKEAIQESETAMVKFANSIREIKWEHFDYLQEQISNITEEADFLIDLMDNSDLYTDNGQLTDTGMATMGLHGQNYNVYMAQADKYAEELLELNKEIAEDPNNTKLLERREELLESQRDAILAAEDEKQAIVDMVREGIELELSALQDLIDKYTESLDSAKDLYDYQKKIKDQTSEIASLQKQISAYAGDTSEENRAIVQKLQVDLADAMEDLEETQYDHYISEQKKLLDNLYDEYEMILNERLDNIDALLSDMIDSINTNSSSICDTLLSQAEKVGYTITENEKAIWSNEGGAFSIITKYGESFLTQMTTVNDVISKIAIKIGAMVSESDKKADTTVSNTTTTTKTDTSVKPQTQTNNKTTTNTTQSKFNEDVKRGVAAAIWIYGGSKSGWGNDPQRKQRLTAKFGASNATAVQSYINAHANNGDLYKYWVSTGKSNLSQYYYSAFKKGGLADYTGMAWLDGTPSEPEMVLNPEDTANFIALKDAMRSIADGNSPLADLFGGEGSASNILTQLAKIENPLSTNGSNVGDITYQITIPIDHVQDYEDFMNQMRKDGKFEKFIHSITIDRLTGGSKIAKNKYQW